MQLIDPMSFVLSFSNYKGTTLDPMDLTVASILTFYCEFGQFLVSIENLPQSINNLQQIDK